MNENTPFALFVVAVPLAVFGFGVLLGLLGRWLTKPTKRDRADQSPAPTRDRFSGQE